MKHQLKRLKDKWEITCNGRKKIIYSSGFKEDTEEFGEHWHCPFCGEIIGV